MHLPEIGICSHWERKFFSFTTLYYLVGSSVIFFLWLLKLSKKKSFLLGGHWIPLYMLCYPCVSCKSYPYLVPISFTTLYYLVSSVIFFLLRISQVHVSFTTLYYLVSSVKNGLSIEFQVLQLHNSILSGQLSHILSIHSKFTQLHNYYIIWSAQSNSFYPGISSSSASQLYIICDLQAWPR